ncbi:MAG: chemotaxis protein CheW [Rhodothermales bacterium]|nr:chemotaxis protein CheW [Rhodothermales bacterium]
MDAHARFNLPARTADESSRIVVVEVGATVVGFMMDAVKEVIRVDPATIEPPPDLAVGGDADDNGGGGERGARRRNHRDGERGRGGHARAACRAVPVALRATGTDRGVMGRSVGWGARGGAGARRPRRRTGDRRRSTPPARARPGPARRRGG